MSTEKSELEAKGNGVLVDVSFSNEQKNYLIQKLTEHWDKHGDSTTYEGIKMAKRVVRNL
jgi:hypothetical protein